MSSLFVVRHGQARLFTENYDRLSETGIRQAERLGEWWVKRGVVPDAIYAGSLTRQQHTAKAVMGVLKKTGIASPELQVLEGLNEYPAEEIMRLLVPALRKSDANIDSLANEYEQANDDATRYRPMHQLLASVMRYWITADYADNIDLLSWLDFSSSVRVAFEQVMKQTGNGKVAAVFTSGGPIGISVQTVLKAPELTAADLNWRVNNASVSRFSFSGDRVSLDTFNDTAHLEPALLTYR